MKEAIGKRNIWLDLFKLYLCWLVVCIHIAGSHYPRFGLYRIAVPMFFMISGFFAYHKTYETRRKKSKVFLKRSTAYMLFGLGFYIVFNFIVCLKDDLNPTEMFKGLYFADVFRNFFLRNQNPLTNAYHLWFIIALFTVAILHLLLVHFKKENWYFIIIPLGIAVHLFFNGYVKDYNGEIPPLSYTRNGLFFGLPMFGIGYCLAKFNLNRKVYLKYFYLILGIVCFQLQVQESRELAKELYISSILSSVFLLLFFTGLKPRKCEWFYNLFGKSMPFYVYILHLAVWKRLEEHKTITDRYEKCFWVFIISIAIYEIAYLSLKATKWGYGKLKKKIKLPTFYGVEDFTESKEGKNMKINEMIEKNTVEADNQTKEKFKIFEKENAKKRVLFLGNSITLHEKKPEIGWNVNWGMAASSEENDYVHVVVKGLEARYGAISYCIVNVAEWEKHYFTDGILEKFDGARDFKADTIILRLGENVRRDSFETYPLEGYLREFIDYFITENTKVVVTDLFWEHTYICDVLKKLAEERGFEFAKISDLGYADENKAIGLFEHAGVAGHPGDLGMKRIAERILEKL